MYINDVMNLGSNFAQRSAEICRFHLLTASNYFCISAPSLTMLDLEVVPERSLGNEQWEFILGVLRATQSIKTHWLFSLKLIMLTRFTFAQVIYTSFFSVSRNACCTVRSDSQTTVSCYKIRASDVQRGGKQIVPPKKLFVKM